MVKNKNVIDIFNMALDQGVSISLNKDNLKLNYNEDAPPSANLIQVIKENKAAIVDFLNAEIGDLETVNSLIPEITYHDRSKLDKIPLSFAQEQIWFIDQLRGSENYHISTIKSFNNTLDIPALKFALNAVINRNEILRTVIGEENGKAFQKILPKNTWQFSHEKIENLPKLNAEIREEIIRPFDLKKHHVLRAKLYETPHQKYTLVIVGHHIALDGWSMDIFLHELLECYQSTKEGRSANLPPINIQYADYAIWQRTYLKEKILGKKLSYWENKLKNVSYTELPLDHTRPSIQSMRGSVQNFEINPNLTQSIQELCQVEQTTLFSVLLTTCKILFYKYSGQTDICIGSPMANRGYKALESMIGFFVNTLPIRTNLENNPSFISLLKQVKQTTIEAYKHQDTPLEQIVDRVLSKRDISMHPLFQVLFVLQNTPKKIELEGEAPLPENILNNQIESKKLQYAATTSKFDLTLNFVEGREKINFGIEYCTDLFKSETIQQIATHFSQLLAAIIEDPTKSIDELSLITKQEETQIINDFNNEEISYPQDLTIVDLFNAQVKKTPNKKAVSFNGQSLTYQELDNRSNQLSHYLKEKGVKQETLVGICVERSFEMIVGILGIIKAGGTYVPIDPDYPEKRIKYILQDSDIDIVITTKKIAKLFNTSQLVLIDKDWSTISTKPSISINIQLHPNNLIYVIYTSGSTGNPKGVLIEHQNVVRLFKTDQPLFSFNENDVWTLFHSFCFDFSVWEMYGALLFGGVLCIVPKEVTKDTIAYTQFISNNNVTVLNQTPSAFYSLQEYYVNQNDTTSLRYVIFGGEALSPPLLKDWKKKYPNCHLINMYGITETCVHVTFKEITKKDIELNKSNIGRPIPTLQCYILDAKHQLSPIGISGEIYVKGAGLARGYLNRSDLTKSRFIKSSIKGVEGRLYRTGDLAKWMPNGDMEYLGRIDDQVKVRGYRIELGEIEAVLGSSELVKQSVVVTKEDVSGNQRLIAYVVPEENFEQAALQSFLLAQLPKFMVPSLFIELKSLPLTINGKLDKKALPSPDITAMTQRTYVAPRNKTEKELVQIWKELLRVESIGIEDDFFELGGNSLMVTRVVSAIRQNLNIELKALDIFINSNIKELMVVIKEKENDEVLSTVKLVEKPRYIPASFAQERFWFIDQLSGSTQYHLPYVKYFDDTLNVAALTKALKTLVDRHQTLRTVIKESKKLRYQEVIDSNSWEIEQLVLNQETSKDEINAIISEYIHRPFSLDHDYMIRAKLVKIGTKGYVLTIIIHHIAADGWSMNIFFNEFVELYSAYSTDRSPKLEQMTLQYTDYTIWEHQHSRKEQLDRQLDFWENRLAGLEHLELPLDFPRPKIQSINGSDFDVVLDESLTKELKTLCKESGATLFMLMLASFKILLYKYTRQTDICVGSPIANRGQKEIENLIGPFVNSVALRSDLSNNPTFIDFLKSVKETTLEAHEYQDVPFEKIVERLVKDRDLTRSPIFQVMIEFQNTPTEIALVDNDGKLLNQQIDKSTLDLEEAGRYLHAKFELILHIKESDGRIILNFEYCTDLFERSTIKRWGNHYKNLLTDILKKTEAPIDTISILDNEERQILLKDFCSPSTAISKTMTIIDHFDTQVNKNPEAIALSFGNQVLNYKELDEKSNQLANFLIKKGVKKQDRVGLFFYRETGMIVSLLGILKCGATYVPLNIDYPTSRLEYILEDASIHHIVLGSIGFDQLTEEHESILTKTESYNFINIKDAENSSNKRPVLDLNIQDPAYVMYTSGSTGQPKGILVGQLNIIKLALDPYLLNITLEDRVLQWSNFAFDGSTFEIFNTFLNGASLHLISKSDATDPNKLSEIIQTKQLSVVFITTALFNVFVDFNPNIFKGLRKIVIGGDAASGAHVKKALEVLEPNTIINGYGPTETTTFAVCHAVEQVHKNSIPIGKPLTNTKVYVTNNNGDLAGIGVIGELWITGQGVSYGYLNRPKLTASVFIDDPFDSSNEFKVYKTGDLVRWLENGQIEFVGRKDDQVKIRGNRIELKEVELAINACNQVKQNVVVVRKDASGVKNLISYIVPQGIFDQQIIQKHLKSLLPEYMIPAFLVEMNSLPLTRNGKINKKELPDPDPSSLNTKKYIAPRNEMEQKLEAIWKELLDIELIGVNDSFFQIGGHSLLATRLIAAIRDEFNLNFPVRLIFEFPTIAQLADYIQLMDNQVEENSLETEVFEL